MNKKVAIVHKYLPIYRYGVFNKISCFSDPVYEIFADSTGREGITTIPEAFAEKKPDQGGVKWFRTKSYYYKNSLQAWQSGILQKIFFGKYSLFILEGVSSQPSSWIFALACRLIGKKVIFWSHGFKGTDKGLKKLIRTVFFKHLPDGLILYGNFSKNIMVQAGFDGERIFVIGNSLNYTFQKSIRDSLLKEPSKLAKLKEELFSNDYQTIIFIGRLVPNKKVHEVVEMIARLDNAGFKLNCILIGDGPERTKLQSRIDELSLTNRCYFAGEIIDESEIAPLFLISDLMVSPGNVGLNCIHALAYGVPVITHNNFSLQNPEVEAITDQINGRLYQFGDLNDMTEKVKSWLFSEHPDRMKYCIKPVETDYNPESHAEKINRAVLYFLNGGKHV